MAKTFRHSAGFGKRIEYWIIGNRIRQGDVSFVLFKQIDTHPIFLDN